MAIAPTAQRPGTYPADASDDRRGAAATLVEPRGGGVALPAAEKLRGHRPIWAFAAVALVGYALLAAAIVLLGRLLIDLVLPIDSVADADRWLPGWLAEQRGPLLDDASLVGSTIGDVPVLPALVLAVLIAAALAGA